MNDGINKIPELVDLLHRCKTVVVKLDSKCNIMDNERAKTDDRRVMVSWIRLSILAKTTCQYLQVVFR